MDTQVGFGVITLETLQDGSISLATTRRVISVSVIIPARPPDEPITKEASPRFLASFCVTSKIVSSIDERRGFFGRNFETGRSSFVDFADLTDPRAETDDLPPTDRPALAPLPPLFKDAVPSSISMALSNNERQPSFDEL